MTIRNPFRTVRKRMRGRTALAVKTYWYKIRGFFKRGQKAESGPRETPE